MSTPTRIVLEVCVASIEEAVAAASGGADRLELNMGMELGGLTPTIGLLEEVKQSVEIPVVAMVRPRPGGFHYSPAELRSMMRDAEMLLAAGTDGIVSGALQKDGTLDENFWGSLRRLSEDRQLIFHRASDAAKDQTALLKRLVDAGTSRVLTSGGSETAWVGRNQISRMQSIFGKQIEILVGSGVSPDNAVALVQSTGCKQVHGSFSQRQHDSSGYLGNQSVRVTSEHLVASTRKALDRSFIG